MDGLIDYSVCSESERVEYAKSLILSSELSELAYDSSSEVRIAVAYNPYTDV